MSFFYVKKIEIIKIKYKYWKKIYSDNFENFKKWFTNFKTTFLKLSKEFIKFIKKKFNFEWLNLFYLDTYLRIIRKSNMFLKLNFKQMNEIREKNCLIPGYKSKRLQKIR